MIDVDFMTGCTFVMCTDAGILVFVFVFVLKITGVPAVEMTGACDTLTALCGVLKTCAFIG